MKELGIPFVPLNADSSFDDIDAELNGLASQALDHLLWSNDGYRPKVNFVIAHNGNTIFLTFKVQEDDMRAIYNHINDPVYKDSCVEFFISIENDTNYYNLEFNCLGTCTIGYGKDKFNREALPADMIGAILSRCKIERVRQEFVYAWQITLVIPVTVFVHHSGIDLTDTICRLNFYKCGDDLSRPHFMAWNDIEWPEPNFHLSRFFGKGVFL